MGWAQNRWNNVGAYRLGDTRLNGIHRAVNFLEVRSFTVERWCVEVEHACCVVRASWCVLCPITLFATLEHAYARASMPAGMEDRCRGALNKVAQATRLLRR